MFQRELNSEERTVMALCDLYSAYGYRQYKVSKFESYDLYASNRNFLQSKQILTFTDTNGRLMALKPDVTLSIIKNTKPDARITKVFYTENVYRVPKNGDGFQEIMQTGLELIGEVDDYAMAEVVMLAERSLRAISGDYVLDLSHIGVISGLMDAQGIYEERRDKLMEAVGQKNLHRIRSLCGRYALPETFCVRLEALVRLYGPLEEALDEAETMDLPEDSLACVRSLRRLSGMLRSAGCRNLRLDFSLINDMDYYNGLVLRGFIAGVAAGVLSGGRYDNLMAKMGRAQSAIGFAVYLDQLERINVRTQEFDVDTVLYYNRGSDMSALFAVSEALISDGHSVRVLPEAAGPVRARKTLILEGTEVRPIG